MQTRPGAEGHPGTDSERGEQRTEEQQVHRGDGAHQRPALGHRSVLHQHRRQRLPEPLRPRPRRAGATRCSAPSPRAPRWSTRSPRSPPPRWVDTQDVPVNDVLINPPLSPDFSAHNANRAAPPGCGPIVCLATAAAGDACAGCVWASCSRNTCNALRSSSRVVDGSITASTYPRSAATHGVATVAL